MKNVRRDFRRRVLFVFVGLFVVIATILFLKEKKESTVLVSQTLVEPALTRPSPLTSTPTKNANGPSNKVLPNFSYRDKTRLALYIKQVDFSYGAILQSMGLAPQKIREIEDLLVMRLFAIDDAHDLAVKQHLDAAALKERVAAARNELDGSLSAATTPQVFDEIKAMLAATIYIYWIQDSYAPKMAQAGVPLSASNILPLGTILYETYDFVVNPQAKNLRLANIDSRTGLSDLDRVALNRAAGTVLNVKQLEVLATQLSASTRGIAASEASMRSGSNGT